MTDDFFISTQVVRSGLRLVFTDQAIAREPVSDSGGAEFQRKVRLMTRGLRGVVEMRALLNPWRYGFYAVQLFSHKVLRRVVVFALIALVLTSPVLWQHGIIFQAATIAQVGFYGLAGLACFIGIHRSRLLKVLGLPAFFVLANTAALLATVNLVRGKRIEVWTPHRSSPAAG